MCNCVQVVMSKQPKGPASGPAEISTGPAFMTFSGHTGHWLDPYYSPYWDSSVQTAIKTVFLKGLLWGQWDPTVTPLKMGQVPLA